MRILVLNGSPKAKSDTMVLTNAMLKGLNEAGEHQITMVDVIKKDIKPCIGCFGCWKNGDGKCIQKDDQNDILEKYTEADLIIWSFPLYCYAMPSHLKAVLDRTIPLVQMKMVEVDGRIQHVPLVDFSKKKTVVISGCGFPNWEGNFDGLRLMCRNCFGNLTMVCVPETPLLNVKEAKPVADRLVAKFVDAGREYTENGGLSEMTIAALEEPMISKDEYLKGVNG